MQPPTQHKNGRHVIERRKAARHRRQVKVDVTNESAKVELGTAWAADSSLGGISLQIHEEIRPGVILRVRPTGVPPKTRWVKVEVRSCRPSKAQGNFELGCQFVTSPSYSVLLLFR